MAVQSSPRAHDAPRTPQRAELLAAVESVKDVLASVADEAQRIGTLPEAGWRALHDSGLFRMKSPRELGGGEADPITQIDVFERVAYIDSSAGWTLFVGAGTSAIISGWLRDEAIHEYLVDGRLPRVTVGLVPSGTATPVDGGYRVTGRWQFGSGCKHAEWLGGNAIVAGGNPPVAGFLFPRSDVTIHDNWQVGGLQGSGSNDFSVEDVFVPRHRMYDNAEPARRGGALFGIGLPGLVANEHAAFSLGVARRALDEVTELAKSKSRGYIQPQGTAARGVFQFELGRHDIALRAARALLVEAYEAAWQTALAGGAITTHVQTELRCAAVYASDVALDVCRFAFRYAGARSLFRGNVIERALRDVTAASQHGMVNDAAFEARGQSLLGFDGVAALG